MTQLELITNREMGIKGNLFLNSALADIYRWFKKIDQAAYPSSYNYNRVMFGEYVQNF